MFCGCVYGMNCGDASTTTSTQLGVRSIIVAMPVLFKRLEDTLGALLTRIVPLVDRSSWWNDANERWSQQGSPHTASAYRARLNAHDEESLAVTK